ncbi:VPS10 domain-containing protein [Winogradskyella aurantiaca]|uniref:VPS10 domain-containing protein n=1 Tax=Winogradskyella aurantiaca TaxID=2219558 RepID=UPI000E1D0EC0|nr:glycosyl hydrolase [Winogradskyella aurantiaca]
MKKNILLLVLALCAFSLSHSQKSKKKSSNTTNSHFQDSLIHGLKWRNIGPFRGGRSVTSTGVTGDPLTYYMGSTGGGVWKTQDAGISWKNISDGHFKMGTVGAIAVSESDPNIVVVGMGEHAARGVMTSMGDGVYKSMDAGKTWTHLGLEKTRHISDVIIHPTNPDIIFISAQGAQYAPSEDRGIYKTTDGGKNWTKVFYIDTTTGCSSISMDYNNPRILYASMWQHRRYPWYMESGGKSSGLFKSTDGGTTWNEMTEGLPEDLGKSGISVSRADSETVYAVIEAEGEKAGVYKSTNAGDKWTQVNKDRINITRSWYYMEIFADPQNANVVYVLNAPVMKSIDGGKSFSNIPVPHGDNHHLWINPKNNEVMINSNDGGANISFNGGKSWSTQKNQPTVQFYRVITDNRFPYYVYGGQQDNSTVAIASRTNDGGIGWKDWYATAGGESAYLAFDPDDPTTVYGGTYQGNLSRWTMDSKEQKSIKQYPELGLSIAPKDSKYRYNWNAPVITSPHDRNTIYHAGNMVFKSTNEGQSWEVVSPDLTKNEIEKHGPGGGPFTNEAAGGENYNTITALVESQHEEGVLYAGTDDGTLQVTKDGGANWTNVTPKGISDGIINSIDISEHDPAKVYITVMRYKSMDLTPHIFKSSNYGNSWTKIVSGIDDPNGFARVVRADKKKDGVLYAGTEVGMYLSVNDGASWQKLQLNLPITPINDLIIQDNDLVAATGGRGFWILDDLAVFQQADKSDALKIYQPKDTPIFFGGNSNAVGQGQNPRSGVLIDYFLPEEVDSLELTLEVRQDGKLIRNYSSKKPENFRSWPGGPPSPQVLPAKQGFNRFAWGFDRNSLPPVDDVFVFGYLGGSTVAPGTYSLKLTLGDTSSETTVNVLPNPAIEASKQDYIEQQTMLLTIEETVKEMHNAVNNMRSAKAQIKNFEKLLKNQEGSEDLITKGKELSKRISTWEENLIQPKQKTFQDVINFNNKLNSQLLNLAGYINQADPKVTQGAKERLKDLLADWRVYKDEHDAIVSKEMADYNTAYKALNLPAIVLKQK